MATAVNTVRLEVINTSCLRISLANRGHPDHNIRLHSYLCRQLEWNNISQDELRELKKRWFN